jgi:hypothetical protein
MLTRRLAALLIGTSLVIPLATRAAVPACATAQGDWQDITGAGPGGSGSWALQVDDRGNISGTHRYSNSSATCKSGTWGVSGQMRSGGQFQLTATWPEKLFVRPAACALTITRSGSIAQPGCNAASGNWTNSGGASGTFSMSHGCDRPSGDGETTPVFESWNDGGAGTIAKFTQSLLPTNFNYGGRYIYETFLPSETVDTCEFQGSIYGHAFRQNGEPMYRPSEVPSSYEDRIGMEPGLVIYFRNHGRAPCGYAFKQRMKIDCDTATGNQQFRVNDVIMKAEFRDVTSIRSSTVVTKRWGPLPAGLLSPIIDLLLNQAEAQRP